MGLVDDFDIMERLDEGLVPSRIAVHHNQRKTLQAPRQDLHGPTGLATAMLEQWVHDAKRGNRDAINMFWRAVDDPYSVPALALAEQASDTPIGDILDQLMERAGLADTKRGDYP